MKTLTVTLLLILACCLGISEACSCVPGPPPSRAESIRYFFRTSQNIYTARVVRAYCKCYGASSDQTNGLLSCRQYSFDPQGDVQRDTPRQYSCRSGSGFGFPFRNCSSFLNQIARGRTVGPIRPGTEPPVNTTGQMNCGVSRVETDGQNCDLTHQPCYYMVTVGEVFKGNYSTGQSLSVSGPDVLTSCGNYRRVLSLGVDYIDGIGSSGCQYSVSDWENTTEYSASELQLIRDLQRECSMNPMSSVCSGTGLVATHIGMGLLTVLLTVAIAIIVGSY